MAGNLMPVQLVRASTDSQPRKSWWTPLFGWSSDPDYIIDSATNTDQIKPNNITFSATISDQSGLDRKAVRSPAKFTEEKARKLRMLTMETESFPDAMYHSAIASRLASDFSDRSDSC
ncbi:hypothetical protein SSX86_013205 [Deinandra increscens subsp. villosa]|uniref:Uncharacterized protein n=1 Tax=Deinandra increscens subsp. villosa TaxID=3103831 RepID=A0AAP0H1K6_9ASTR